MDEGALARARARLAEARDGRPDDAALEAALERARSQLESFADAAAGLEVSVPQRVGDAIQESLRSEVLPVARQLAEARGLAAQTIRRLERLQGDLDAERRARVDDLALVVELVTSGWQGVQQRLDRLERMLEERRAGALSGENGEAGGAG